MESAIVLHSQSKLSPTKKLKGEISLELTAREKQVILAVCDGLKNSEIGVRIGSNEQVVKNYLRLVFDKCGVWSRLELALWAVAHPEKLQ